MRRLWRSSPRLWRRRSALRWSSLGSRTVPRSPRSCTGETLSGTLVGVVIDDPVTDSGVAECAPSASAVAALYWTRALESVAPAGADCSAIDWTCEGGTSIGIDAYAAWLGIEPQPSIFTDHQPYWVVPEIEEWLN